MLRDGLKAGQVKYRAQENEFEFQNGAILHLCYCDSENDVEKYRGAEIHVLIMDELTHFSEYQYRFLRSRVRRAGLKVPERYKDLLPRIETGSNPGSIGHAWVKRTFIAPRPAGEIWRTSSEEGGMLRQFIPAKLSDNPYLTQDDPTYADRLRGLGSDNLVRAMLDGDWDIIAGAAFEKLRRDLHCIEPFVPPDDWLVFGSLDWGSSRPFSFGLWTVANGNQLPDGRLYQRGAIIRYNELYGWNGKPNEGLRMEVAEVAKQCLARAKRKLAYTVADPSMWKVDGGPSHAEVMSRHGLILRPGDHNRHAGYLEMRGRIAGNEDGPMLFVTKNCHDGFWRTIPDLVMDESDPEDVDTDQEDHCFALGTRTFGGFVGETGPVLSIDGMTQGFSTPIHVADVVRLTFDDGEQIVCTPNHKFATDRGWTEAKDLLDYICYNTLSETRVLWLLSSVIRVKNFLASGIGFVGSIFSVGDGACTAPCGSTITAQSRMGGTSTMLTKTGRTIKSKILTWFDRAIISPITLNVATTGKLSRQHKTRQESGTGQKRAGSGILSTLKKCSLRFAKTRFRSCARFAVRSFLRYGHTQTALFIATLTAVRQRCVAVEKAGRAEVTCLHVNGSNTFALESGTLVHNCYDDARYACMSRPWAKPIERKEPKPDRWLRFEEKDEDTWKVA